MATELFNTTLASAIDKKQTNIKLASVTNRAQHDLLVVDQEVMLVNEVDTTNATVHVQRGYYATEAVAHASGQRVWCDRQNRFKLRPPRGKVVAAEVGFLPWIVVQGGDPVAYRYVNDAWVEIPTERVVNIRCEDPDTGYEYLLVDCQSAFAVGEWVVVDADGLATQLATTSKGRVAIIVETIGASDTLSWVIVAGSYASALTTSGVTTAADLIAAAGHATPLTSDGGNIIWGAVCTAAPSTATSPAIGGAVATVYLMNPWVSGETHSFSSIGG